MLKKHIMHFNNGILNLKMNNFSRICKNEYIFFNQFFYVSAFTGSVMNG
jgi:hypothetical protein